MSKKETETVCLPVIDLLNPEVVKLFRCNNEIPRQNVMCYHSFIRGSVQGNKQSLPDTGSVEIIKTDVPCDCNCISSWLSWQGTVCMLNFQTFVFLELHITYMHYSLPKNKLTYKTSLEML